MARSHSLSIVLALVITLLAAGTAFATPGDIDRTFGEGGRASIDFDERSTATAAVAQPDGRVVIAGAVGGGSEPKAFLARFTASGRLDKSFGTDGITKLEAAGSVRLAATSGGTIYALTAKDAFGGDVFAISANGRRVSTFGTNGKLDISQTFPGISADAIAVQGQNLIVSGLSDDEKLTTSDGVLTRWTPAGVIDPSFGTAGAAHYSASSVYSPSSLAVLTDESIVGVLGTIQKYSRDGVLDTSFPKSSARLAQTAVFGSSAIELAPTPSGGYLAGVTSVQWGRGVWVSQSVRRFNGDGTAVPNFETNVQGGIPIALPDGSVLVTGNTNRSGNRLEASLIGPAGGQPFEVRHTGDNVLHVENAAVLPSGDVVVVGATCDSICDASVVKLSMSKSVRPKRSPGLRRPRSAEYTAGSVRSIEGTTWPRKGVRSVDVAILRVNGGDMYAGTCPWMKKDRLNFVNRFGVGSGPCGRPLFIRASGRANWRLKLRGLANGQYEVHVRAHWRGHKYNPLTYDPGTFARFRVGE